METRQNAALFSALWLVAANALIAFAVLVFATGFFPYKPVLPGLAQRHEDYDGLEAPFDRLVFMVVDALRSDFVFAEDSGFKYTQSLIRDGAALPFTAHATSPTVTMPRLKAITTGSIPSFLDAILNLDETDKTSSLATQDSWLAQMKVKGTGKAVMYGDDTWLKLFPGTFDRADGTTSFFVSDFTEVDRNVTRNIAGELKKDDWNTMVLHYLGLDHIGHKGGPRSFHMLPKQQEMDGIVKQIYTAIGSEKHLQSTLFVLCGDHGMNDAGNHGGSSAGETSPALVFMSPKLQTLERGSTSPLPPKDDFQYYKTVEQSDIAPTLAALLGFPVPQNNLGVFITDFLPLWEKASGKVQILLQNVDQIKAIITATFGPQLWQTTVEDECTTPKSDAEELACEYKAMMANSGRTAAHGNVDQSLSMMYEWLRKAQDVMSSMASNYDMSRLILGQVVAAVAVLCAVLGTHNVSGQNLPTFLPFSIISVAYGVMMFASSYVEEEQHFWYWTTTAWLALIGWKNMNGKISSRKSHFLQVILVLAATRVVRGWNQTGQKFAGEPDIVKTFIHPHPNLLWILVIATYLWIGRDIRDGFSGLSPAPGFIIASGLTIAAFAFKLSYTNEDAPELVSGPVLTLFDYLPGATLVARAQAVFIGLAMATAGVLWFIFGKRGTPVKTTPLHTLHALYTLLAVTQSRTTNIPLFLLFNMQLKFLGSQDLDSAELATATLLLSFTSFFAFGGSNAMSSVDLSNAYNGVGNFNAVAVAVLTFVSNWAAPIYWTFAATTLLVRKRKAGQSENIFLQHVGWLTVFVAFSAAAVMAACTALRTHLFIWTVFSPKYLYCMAWELGQHLLVHIGVGGILYWLGGRA